MQGNWCKKNSGRGCVVPKQKQVKFTVSVSSPFCVNFLAVYKLCHLNAFCGISYPRFVPCLSHLSMSNSDNHMWILSGPTSHAIYKLYSKSYKFALVDTCLNNLLLQYSIFHPSRFRYIIILEYLVNSSDLSIHIRN